MADASPRHTVIFVFDRRDGPGHVRHTESALALDGTVGPAPFAELVHEPLHTHRRTARRRHPYSRPQCLPRLPRRRAQASTLPVAGIRNGLDYARRDVAAKKAMTFFVRMSDPHLSLTSF